MKPGVLGSRRCAGAALALAVAVALPVRAQEEVEVALPVGVVFEVGVLAAGPVAAREPSSLSFRHSRLGPGRALRVSVMLETASGASVAFEGRNPRGGTCGRGRLSPGAFVPVFESMPGALAGGCDFLWTLESPGRVQRAGRFAVTLRWKLESIAGRDQSPQAPAPRLSPGLGVSRAEPNRSSPAGAPSPVAPASPPPLRRPSPGADRPW